MNVLEKSIEAFLRFLKKAQNILKLRKITTGTISEKLLFLEDAKVKGNGIFIASNNNLRTHFVHIINRFNQRNVCFMANLLWLKKIQRLKKYLIYLSSNIQIYFILAYFICHVSQIKYAGNGSFI